MATTLTISIEGTIAMKTEVKFQKSSACALLMNQVSAAVTVLLGVAIEKTKVMMI